MKTLKKVPVILGFWLGTLFFSGGLHAQPVFDLPTTDFTPVSGLQAISIPMTLQVGDIETGIINPVTGEPLNDVALVFNPSVNTLPTDIRIYTIYHNSMTDTRALMLSTPADLTYPVDTGHIPFETSNSVQILDLNRDGQNDLAFNGSTGSISPSPWEEGPAPILGVMGTGTDPFVGGKVDQLGTTISIYNFPIFVGLSPYGGQPSLATGKLGGDAFTDLAINDWRVPTMVTGSDPIDGTGNTGAGQMLRTFFNDGGIGPLPSVATLISIPDPVFDLINAIPLFIVVADFDMNGTDDAAVVYVIQTADDNFEIRLMVYPGNGDGTFNVHPTISENLADLGDFRETNGGPTSLTYGDFDGNGHLDFAVSYNVDANTALGLAGFTAVITCAPGTPPTCSVQQLAFPAPLVVVNIDAGDFDGDGLDDLVQSEETCDDLQCTTTERGQVSAYLNQSGSFSATPDQTIAPALSAADATSIYWQVIARDIDGCSPEDIAFTGVEVPNTGGAGPPAFLNRAIVAFATVADPVADAGFGTPVDDGIQLGGDPTCFDPNGNPTSVLWTQISGDPATISDPTASNPIVTHIGFNEDSVFQVTCSTACAQAQATITVGQTLCISGSGHFWSTIRTGCAGCSLNRGHSGSSPAGTGWMLGLLLGMGWLRLRSRMTFPRRPL